MKRLIDDYIAELRSSPVKATLIAVMLVTGMLLWGRLMLKQVPKTASAGVAEMFSDASEGETSWPEALTTRELALEIPPPVMRDLFELDPNRYKRTSKPADLPTDPKLAPGISDYQRQVAVVSAARALRLQSIVEGEDPLVLIDGQLLRTGQVVKGFTIQSIEARAVVLEMEGVRVRLGL
jgi:hypothetical protein